ncbi:hypothetical protein [Halosegnis marinus]|uniref:Uncharacterized protein n=1 Tax=Halosegnis marinus TaxID=3034023 RepID=A0ABD5ZT58_9EURY|nr:hypothetical protein [Halosegnis sp. DT85]
MANSIKNSGGGLALQITKPARTAGLVEEVDGETTTLADLFVVAVDGTLLVGNRNRIDGRERVELVGSVARDADSIYRIVYTAVQIEGHGYQVQLPNARDAGFERGDTAPVITAPDMLLVTDGSHRTTRRAEDLATIRRDQI